MSTTIDNIVYTYGGSTASVTNFVPGITTANIPSTIFVSPNTYNVTSIGNTAFQGCATLTSVTIPNSVTTIGSAAFASCSLLNFVSIGISVTSIGSSAFFNCISLTSVTIPSSVTSIANTAFLGCSNLNLVFFLQPLTLPSIGAAAFTNISPLSVGKYYSTVIDTTPIAPPVFNSISTITPPYPCFLEGSKILCFENNQEVYREIESLRKGDLVKTIYNGYTPIHMIGTTALYNPGNDYRVANRLYKCSREKYPALFEDLYITGCHSILVPSMTDDQWENTKAANGDVFVTDNHFRLVACADEKAQPYDYEGFMNIYHIALEHNDYYMNYGIYANGLLVESCSKRYLTEISNMRILGQEDCAVSEHVDKILIRQLIETY